MRELSEIIERRTTTDIVFEQLRDEIVSLRMLPGTKLSEVEVAKQFGVSRQPVRDAFVRLANLDLLLIRPQRATEVRGFSLERIAHARFVRLAVELEVLHSACAVWDKAKADALAVNLAGQRTSIDAGDHASFHRFDYEYHREICALSGHPLAFETIEQCKQKVDRMCVLSLGRDHEVESLLDDHTRIAEALIRHDAAEATRVARKHLSRLDDTIDDVARKHAEYFE
ncbi:GntR family transcriptional regulator [Shimia biformata]|uniref:GntR family transcriptional regulator n=1 Tax=Shimia biformata TaxID=1294299 RepID=UPI0019502662|nr:GntR family transcriptional regulator [Shimia biformata]